jgi:hypothetical protein
MPPKLEEMSAVVSMITSGSLESMQMGNASMPAKRLKRQHFPSMTGSPALGPMSPSPSTAVPSVTTATMLFFEVTS